MLCKKMKCNNVMIHFNFSTFPKDSLVCLHLLIAAHAKIDVKFQIGCRLCASAFKRLLAATTYPVSGAHTQDKCICQIRGTFRGDLCRFRFALPKFFAFNRAIGAVWKRNPANHLPLSRIPCPAPVVFEKLHCMHKLGFLMLGPLAFFFHSILARVARVPVPL